jgi:hypothetical protein
MAKRDRLQEKHDLYVKLGKLFGPVQRLVEHPSEYDVQERAETLARYFSETEALLSDFRAFGVGQAGHDYSVEKVQFHTALESIKINLIQEKPLEQIAKAAFEKARAAIDAVPVPRTSVILEAGSPFAAYRRLRALCESDVTKSLEWLDPYFDSSIFHRYLADVRSDAVVTLVGSEPNTHAGQSNRARWDEFLDVSRLYARERGKRYRLVVHSDLHDRWVRFDDKRIYALGGSAKDAGNRDYFTITPVEATAANLQRIQDHLDAGQEFFGPSTPNHR